jgi:hypothetical protein
MDDNTQGTCETYLGTVGAGQPQCGKPAMLRYPAHGGGYMRMCEAHGRMYAASCERWNGETWDARSVSARSGT